MDKLAYTDAHIILAQYILGDCGYHHPLFELTNIIDYSMWGDHSTYIMTTSGNNEYCEQGCTFALLVLEALEHEYPQFAKENPYV